ncbi:unnamed protein product [Owenia fusiformis]|uniref:Matrix-remodeling-associated protein 7 helical domain-containing protein n=1 Tax=Owenia fusiformis TaxID=6347 RepID=A0A8J1Y861_OWEFU|nr:unnamed protein product [Owenia fusiformis]
MDDLLSNPPILVAIIIALTLGIGVLFLKYTMLKQKMLLETGDSSKEKGKNAPTTKNQTERSAVQKKSTTEPNTEGRDSGECKQSSPDPDSEDTEGMPPLENVDDIIMTKEAKKHLAHGLQEELAKMGGCPFSGIGASGEEGDTPVTAPAGADPFEFVEHIQSEVKKVNHKAQEKAIEKELPDFDPAKEREVAKSQMEAIFTLMKEQEDQFGLKSMDEMQDQLKLYMDK